MGFGCYGIIKYLLVFLNLIFGILGICGTVFAIWMLVDPSYSLSVTQDYVISVTIILIASILLIIVTVLGIVGALKGSSCALTSFFCILLIILVAEISAGVWIYINRDSLKLQVKRAVEHTVEEEYHQNENRRIMFDTFQKNLQCCGANAPSDWIGNRQVIVSVTSMKDNYSIPASCCYENVTEELCKMKTQQIKPSSSIDFSVVYEPGCYNAIMSKLEENSFWILVFGIIIAVIQFLALIFALILAFSVNKKRYKD